MEYLNAYLLVTAILLLRELLTYSRTKWVRENIESHIIFCFLWPIVVPVALWFVTFGRFKHRDIK